MNYMYQNHFTLIFFICCERAGGINYVTIATMTFPVERYHVFARKLTWYFIGVYIIEMDLYPLPFLSLTFGSFRRSTFGSDPHPKKGLEITE